MSFFEQLYSSVSKGLLHTVSILGNTVTGNIENVAEEIAYIADKDAARAHIREGSALESTLEFCDMIDRIMERDTVNVGNIENSELQNGDVIRVKRYLSLPVLSLPVNVNFYDHYGIYVSEGKRVIHYTGEEGGGGDFKGMVQETPLSRFLDGANEFMIRRFPPSSSYSGEETVRRARSQLGQRQYSVAFNNCEHFAVWAKTGQNVSSQVEEVRAMLPGLSGLVETVETVRIMANKSL